MAEDLKSVVLRWVNFERIAFMGWAGIEQQH